MKRVVALVSLAGAVAGIHAPAAGQGSDVFGIDPSKQKLTARPGSSLEPTEVFNRTDRTFDVEAFVAPLVQARDGSFDIDDSPLGRRAAGLVLEVDKQQFRMNPDDRAVLNAKWIGLREGQKSAALGLVARAVPTDPAPGEVNSVLRVIGIEFLRLPGATTLSRGRVTAVSAEQGPKKTLQFLVSVKNTGPVWDIARERKFVIRDTAGKARYRGTYDSDLILPGVTRDFPVMVRKVLPAGEYTATGSGKVGQSPITSASTTFRLVGPNELPTSRLDGEDLRADGEIGGEANVVLRVTNTGTLESPVVVRVSLKPDRGVSGTPATSEIKVDSLGVGESRDLSTELGELAEGRYFVTALLTDGKREYERLEANFSAAPAKTFIDRFGTALAIGAGLLLLAIVLALVLRRLRRQRRERDELQARLREAEARATAPAPAAAPPVSAPATVPGRVDINTAGVAELQTLPGVGPRAAERIVEHRDEYGVFASVDDLVNVEGFGASRIAALRDRVST